MLVEERLEGHGGHRDQLELGSGERARDGLTGVVGPQALGLAVVHDECRVVEPARSAEVEDAIAELAVVPDSRVAQRAVGDGDRLATDGVVDDLVPQQHLHRVGAGITVERERDHGFLGLQEADVGGPLELRCVDGGDAVGWRPAGEDIEGRHQRFGQQGRSHALAQRRDGGLARAAGDLGDPDVDDHLGRRGCRRRRCGRRRRRGVGARCPRRIRTRGIGFGRLVAGRVIGTPKRDEHERCCRQHQHAAGAAPSYSRELQPESIQTAAGRRAGADVSRNGCRCRESHRATLLRPFAPPCSGR